MNFRGIAIGGPKAGESFEAIDRAIIVWYHPSESLRVEATVRAWEPYADNFEFPAAKEFTYYFYPIMSSPEGDLGYWLPINVHPDDRVPMSTVIDLIHQAVNQNIQEKDEKT